MELIGRCVVAGLLVVGAVIMLPFALLTGVVDALSGKPERGLSE